MGAVCACNLRGTSVRHGGLVGVPLSEEVLHGNHGFALTILRGVGKLGPQLLPHEKQRPGLRTVGRGCRAQLDTRKGAVEDPLHGLGGVPREGLKARLNEGHMEAPRGHATMQDA